MTRLSTRSFRGFGAALVTSVALAVLAPQPSQASACDDRLRQPPQRMTGTYVAAGEPYARSFVFAMLMECKGKQEVVTVQRATGRLPVCDAGQQVDVTGTLVWNKYLVDGHYEINEPSAVTCRAVAESTPPPAMAPPVAVAPAPRVASPPPASSAPASPAPAVASPPPAVAMAPAQMSRAPAVWQGRYQDSRGAGAATFTLLRGVTTVSGTWKLRTGGGGPVTGLIESDGRRIRLRMENISPECPGTLEGDGEISETTLTVAYRGQDCEGGIAEGRLELRLQATSP